MKVVLKYIRKIILPLLILVTSGFLFQVKAAPITTGTSWSDDFSDNTGFSSRTNLNVDIASDSLKLTNAGGTYTSPYLTSGNAISVVAIPELIGAWDQLEFDASTPTGTTIVIQFLHGNNTLYSDIHLPGNSTGFSTSPIDISSIPVDYLLGSTKLPGIKIRVTMTTSDTVQTPELNSWSLTWENDFGTNLPTVLADTSWPTYSGDMQGTFHTNSTNAEIYSVPRWLESYNQRITSMIRGFNNDIIISTMFNTDGDDGFFAGINKTNGDFLWERPVTYAGVSGATGAISLTLADDGSLFVRERTNDLLSKYNVSNNDPQLNWMFNTYNGHGNDHTAIGSDGSIYTVHDNLDDFDIIARNPDGSEKWTVNFNPPDACPKISPISLGPDDTLYLQYSSMVSGCTLPADDGTLLAIDPTDGSEKWSYDVGDIFIFANPPFLGPVVDTDGTIYSADSNIFLDEKKIFAINPNGSLKWEYSIGTSYDLWNQLSLRSDGVLVAIRLEGADIFSGGVIGLIYHIDLIDTDTGILISSKQVDTLGTLSHIITDDNNGTFVSVGHTDEEFNPLLGEPVTEVALLSYFDSELDERWQAIFDFPTSLNARRSMILDETGSLYMTLNQEDPDTGENIDGKIVAFYPWTLEVVTDFSDYSPSDTISFTVTTAMQENDPYSNDDNYLQIVFENDDILSLSYASTQGDGDTVWTGEYIIPESMAVGVHNFIVEANSSGILTDTTVHFSLPANNSNNTGITENGTFTISEPESTPSPTPTPILSNSPLLKLSSIGDVQIMDGVYSYNVSSGENITFSGISDPFANITITVHSDPLVCTTTANSQGVFSCTFSLIPDGYHDVYIVATSVEGVKTNYPKMVLGVNVELSATGRSFFLPLMIGGSLLISLIILNIHSLEVSKAIKPNLFKNKIGFEV